MANIDIQEIFNELNSVDKDIYKEIITLSKNNIDTTRIQLTKIRTFLSDKYNRNNAIDELYESTKETSSIDIKYSGFLRIKKEVGKQNTDLDNINGFISRTTYGQTKKRKLNKRLTMEYRKNLASIQNSIVSIEEQKENLEDLESKLT